MNSTRVRTIHRRLGISIVFFLSVQAMAGMLMSIGRLASMDASPLYSLLYSIHAGWHPWGSIYRVVLGLATATQGILGIMIFRSRVRLTSKKDTSIPSPDRPSARKAGAPMRTPSFAADIRPLFRDSDIKAMKPNGIDLSSYEEVKKHAQDIYARLSAKEMPCDKPWSDSQVKKLKEWMESGMEP